MVWLVGGYIPFIVIVVYWCNTPSSWQEDFFLIVKFLYSLFQYNIKKKEEPVELVMEDNPLMRKKKTPEELAAEAEQEDLDDFTSKLFNIKLNPFTSFFR